MATILGDWIYSWRKAMHARGIPAAVISLAIDRMKQDFSHSIVHDRALLALAAEEAAHRYQVVAQARGRPLLSKPPPRLIALPSPTLHGAVHPKDLRTPEAREVVDAARRLRRHIGDEMRCTINIVSSAISIGFNLSVASMAKSYDLPLDIFTQSRMGVEQLQKLLAKPEDREYHFGTLPEGPIFFSDDPSVNNYEWLIPFFCELQMALGRTPQSNSRRRRKVYYFGNSSSEEQFQFLYAKYSHLHGHAVPYLEELIETARSGLDRDDWIIVWEPIASSLVRQSADQHDALHRMESKPFKVIFWLLGAKRLLETAPDFVRDFVYVLASEWDYLRANEVAAIRVLGRRHDMLQALAAAAAYRS